MLNPKANNPEELTREIMTFFINSESEKKSNKINLSKAPFHLQTVETQRSESRQLLDLDEELEPNMRYINVIFGKKISEIELKLNTSASSNCKDVLDENEQKAMSGEMNLYNCFDLFQKEEDLDQDNTWYCKKCKDSKEAKIKMQTYQLPPLLVLHLKRFKNIKDRRYYMMREEYTKNNVQINFPVEG